MENIVFYFSGTGNCLKVAKTIVKEIGNGEIVSMGRPEKYKLTKQYDTIGFVFPVYFFGIPNKAAEFMENLNLGNNQNAYIYVIATCGGFSGGSLNAANKLLFDKHGVTVHYSKQLKMFSNYVVWYDMSTKVHEITEKSDKKLAAIIDSIKRKKNNKVGILYKIIDSLKMKKELSNMDRDYNVSDDCIGCGICREVCPVRNIEMANGKPSFNHKCEQCVACIQFCPRRAINYKNVTQNRGRYTNPEIDYRELAQYNSCV